MADNDRNPDDGTLAKLVANPVVASALAVLEAALPENEYGIVESVVAIAYRLGVIDGTEKMAGVAMARFDALVAAAPASPEAH